MQYTDTLQTRVYQKAEQLEVQLESGARVLLMLSMGRFASSIYFDICVWCERTD